ncbi:MAG: hypothetical protein HYV27_19525 [Candidatus Hydrogenedentes bacterium]|nr:hypothetical protein [Candidatus Hydrogenedentota bacterium]
MTGKYSLQLRFPGGIMPLRELRRVAMAGISHGTGQIYAGDRQQFRLPLRAAGTEPQVRALLQGLAVEHTVGAPLNIVSNALSMRSGTPWLSPGRFQGTLDSFNKSALRIPVDLIDPLRDGHLPGYGSLRFYAHEEEDFWIPAVRTAHSQGLVLFPGGVRNAELPLAAEALEPLIRWRRSFDMAEMLKSVERAVPGGLRPLAANGLTHTLLPRSEREVDECRVALPLDDAPLSCALL